MTVEVILIGQQQNVVERWNNQFDVLEVFAKTSILMSQRHFDQREKSLFVEIQ